MADKNINEFVALSAEDFDTADELLVWDVETGATKKASISTIATVSGTKGGFTFTGGFDNRYVPSVDDPLSRDPKIYVEDGDVDKWIPLDLSSTKQTVADQPWWPGAEPSNGIDLFGGSALPFGVTRMMDYTQTWDWSAYETNGDVAVSNYGGTTRTGTLRFDELETGTTNLIRVDLWVTPQIANTTLEVGLWFQPKQALDGADDGGAFQLAGTPLFFGTGTVGRRFNVRPVNTMYIASAADQFAYALPAIKSDNPVIIEPITMLVQNLR